jgi:hypothetical protein
VWKRWQNSCPHKKQWPLPPAGWGPYAVGEWPQPGWCLTPYTKRKEMPPCTLGSSHRTLKDPEEAEWRPPCEQKRRKADLVEGTGNFRCCFWKHLQGQIHLPRARSLTHTYTLSLSLFSSSQRDSSPEEEDPEHRTKRIQSLVVASDHLS